MKEKKIRVKQWIFKPEYWSISMQFENQAAIVDTTDGSFKVYIKYNKFVEETHTVSAVWHTKDVYDHQRLAYKTKIDLREVKLRFKVKYTNLKGFDEHDGMTIVDNNGNFYYVRLWHYATWNDPWWEVEIDFSTVKAGWNNDEEIPMENIQRVQLDYQPTSTPAECVAEYQDWEVEGGYLRNEDVYVPVSECCIATDYDDIDHLSPARVMKNIEVCGFEGKINHYLGFGKYADRVQSGDDWIIDDTKDFNTPCKKWHESFWSLAHEKGFIIQSGFSLEMHHPPAEWKQKAYDGETAEVVWGSSVVTWFNDDVRAYIKKMFLTVAEICDSLNIPIHLQIDEYWYWCTYSKKPCFYDDYLKADFLAEKGRDIHQWQSYEDDYEEWVDDLYWLRDKLGDFCQEIRDYVQATYPSAKFGILFYTPEVLGRTKGDGSASMLHIANFPFEDWRSSEFNWFKLENYDYVIEGEFERVKEDFKWLNSLGYTSSGEAFYMTGWCESYSRQIWENMRKAGQMAEQWGKFNDIFVWSLSRIMDDDISFLLNDYWG